MADLSAQQLHWRPILTPECCAENGTVPDCACPHEHWHIGAAAGSCLDVHLEEDGSAHITFDWGDCEREILVTGIAGMDEARAIAFGWLDALAASPTPKPQPIMLCDHCGRAESNARDSGSTHCNAPFAIQPHSFTRPHPYLKAMQ